MTGENDVADRPHRQPAYDAVYAVIGRTPPRSTDSYGQAAENARVWRAVEAALDAMEAAGLLLPAGTETIEQWGARITRDGELFQEPDAPSTKETVQARVDFHARKRAEVPGWRGDVVPVRRQQHTTPWEPVDSSSVNLADPLEALLDMPVRIQFWACPVDEHSHRTDAKGRPVGTVEWRGDIAYCTADDCRRNSMQTTPGETP